MEENKFTFSKYGLDVRLVNINDAEFIFKLRSQKKSITFLNTTSNSIINQIDWIRDYKIREKHQKEFYLIFSKNGVKLGVERLYDIKKDFFTFGSLVFDEDAPVGASIIGDIISKEIGFEILGLKTALFDVRKNNKSVIKYHQTFKPQLIDEDESTYYYSLTKENFNSRKNIFLKTFYKF